MWDVKIFTRLLFLNNIKMQLLTLSKINCRTVEINCRTFHCWLYTLCIIVYVTNKSTWTWTLELYMIYTVDFFIFILWMKIFQLPLTCILRYSYLRITVKWNTSQFKGLWLLVQIAWEKHASSVCRSNNRYWLFFFLQQIARFLLNCYRRLYLGADAL